VYVFLKAYLGVSLAGSESKEVLGEEYLTLKSSGKESPCFTES
jgi:hypothetical protein